MVSIQFKQGLNPQTGNSGLDTGDLPWKSSWNRSHCHHRLKCNSEEALQKTLKALYPLSMIKQYHRDRKFRDIRLQTPTLPKVDCCPPRISAPVHPASASTPHKSDTVKATSLTWRLSV